MITNRKDDGYLARPEIMKILKGLKKTNTFLEYPSPSTSDNLLKTLKGAINVAS